jgi:chemotaxis protein CheD
MMNHVVGVGDCQIKRELGDCLITYALGSCIAIAIYDPVTHVTGLLHYLLPDSTIDSEKAAKNPYMFADTGIPTLFHSAYSLGAEKKRLRVTVAGGAQVLASELFQIGKRNQLAMKKILWRAGVLICHEETGGDLSRTIRIDISTGDVFMKLGGRAEQQIGAKQDLHSKGRASYEHA